MNTALRLLAATTQQETAALEFAGAASAWARLLTAVALVAGLALTIALYRREARVGAGSRLRMGLAGLRCVVLVAVALIWLDPVLATYLRRTAVARVVVLVDDSFSMRVADGADPAADAAPRHARVSRLLLDHDAAWLRALAEHNEVAVYSFGRQIARLSTPLDEDPTAAPRADDPAAPTVADALREAEQPRTDLGEAVTQALDDLRDAPLAAVIVLSDGALNHGLDSGGVATILTRTRAPTFCVGVGEPIEPRNLRLADLTAPAVVAAGDPLEIVAAVTAAGDVRGEVAFELLVEPRGESASAPAGPRAIAQRSIEIAPDEQPRTVRFRVPADIAGEFLFSVRAAPLAGEAVLEDNVRAHPVIVLDERLRVLIIAGRPSYDYRAVTRLLERDRSIDVSCWLQSADPQSLRDGDVVIDALPRKPEELLSYDAILLLDPDPRELDSAWSILLRRFVDELGGGLLYQAGPQYSQRLLADPRLEELLALLPAAPEPDAALRLGQRGPFGAQALTMRAAPGAGEHPLIRLAPEADSSAQVWAALPGAWWNFPLQRAKPLAEVLLRGSPDPEPRPDAPALLVVQPVGAGRVALLAFDGTWRWRSTAEDRFNHFWVQTVRFLAQARREGGNRRGSIVLDRESVEVGAVARVEARVLDEQFQPWSAPRVSATLETADAAAPFTLEAIEGREGWFGGNVTFATPGPAVLRLPLPGSDPATQPAEALVKYVQVNPSEIEFRTLRRHDEALTQIASATGGAFLSLAEAADLPQRIRSASVTTTVEGPKRKLWDRAAAMLLVAALLAVEWTLRRRNHLL